MGLDRSKVDLATICVPQFRLWSYTKEPLTDNQLILTALLQHKSFFDQEELTPARSPEATRLIHENSFAFISACCLDRGTKAEIIWTIPYWISQQVGHYDPQQFYALSLDQITSLFLRLPSKPRYINDAPRTFHDIAALVVNQFAGEAENIWKGRRALEVKRVLLSVHGVGSGIANMTLVLLESTYNFTFSDLDHSHMDIKPDVHTMRVLYRLGISPAINEQEATDGARVLSPSYPGLIDGPLWSIGRNWCHAANPNCPECPMNSCCPKEEQ